MKHETTHGKGRLVVALLSLTCMLSLVMVGSAESALAKQKSTKPQVTANSPLDINTASAEELTALPGIGSTMAKRIVAFRDEHGSFRRIEDLMRVQGIGEKSFLKLKALVTVAKRPSEGS